MQKTHAEDTDYIECYIPGSAQCTALTQDECASSDGILQDASNPNICEQGCCCYEAANKQKTGEFDASRGFCDDKIKTNPTAFFSAKTEIETEKKQYTATTCAEYCMDQVDKYAPKTGTACDDGIDNDGDGKTDYGSDPSNDPDCISKAMNSELGLDTCLTKPETDCDCGGKKCSAGKFCYDKPDSYVGKKCEDEPPKDCKDGDKLAVSLDDNGCQQVIECAGGKYGSAVKLENCPKTELCNDGIDNNENGQIDCADIECNSLKCGDTANAPNNCKVSGKIYAKYIKSTNNFWVCCAGEAKDCDKDGTPDSCDACPTCQDSITPKPVTITKVNHAAGKKEIILNYDNKGCPVPVTLLHCIGTKEECKTPATAVLNKWTETAAKNTLLPDIIDTIEANKNYCYSIQSNYPNAAAKIYSDVVCESSGDEICLTTPYKQGSEFCIKNPSKDVTFPTFDTEIYSCDDKNRLKAKNSNELPTSSKDTFCEKQGPNKYCYGPDQQGEASCVYQSTCIFCGNPFNMYATPQSKLIDPGDEFNEKLCMKVPLCYYETTKTVNDAFEECKGIDACSDYKTQDSCSALKNNYKEAAFNNKCLTRDCLWKQLYPELGAGICAETNIDFNICSQCEESAFNAILDYCDVNKCKKFSSEQTKCYKAGTAKNDMSCSPEPEVACTDFLTPEECYGENQLEIDVQYKDGKRISGTNKVKVPSINFLDIPTCYWKNSNPEWSCYKDADGNGFQDPGDKMLGNVFDITPPKTILLTPKLKTRTVDLSFSVTDDSVRGRPSSGLKETYYCYNKATNDNLPCYPDKLYKLEPDKPLILPIDHGLYNLYYYSVDNSDNLEEVQSVTIDVDRKPPVIDMKYTVIPDTSYPYIESTVVITVTTDEEATCSDKFEGTQFSEIDIDTGKAFQVKYNNLEDGVYRYTISCTDSLGNKGETSFLIKVDADLMIQNTLPTGILDNGEITLEATTLAEADCAIGGAAFQENQEIEIPSGKAYKYSSKITLTESKEYQYSILCAIDGEPHGDEIQFVLDKQAPKTTIIDINANPFDTSLFYKSADIAEKLFFSCSDDPKSLLFGPTPIGFSCDKTYFCIAQDNALCEPDPAKEENTYNPIYSIDAAFSQASQQWLCYKSREKMIEGKGGLFEEKNCVKFQIDSHAPIIDVDYLAQYSTPDNSYQWYGSTYDLAITIVDPDAALNPPANNKVTVEVITNGVPSGFFEEKPANEKLTITAELAQGLNEIKVTATDRSGDTAAKSYYISRASIQEQLIQLVLPPKGISENSEFSFQIKLKESLGLTASKCILSESKTYIKSNEFNEGNGKVFTEKLTLTDADQGIPKVYYVKCFLQGSIEAEQTFVLVFDNTTPIITSLTIDPSNNKDPPALTDFPIKTNLTVKTDDLTRCKFTKQSDYSYSNMLNKFQGYDEVPLRNINQEELSNEYPATDLLHRIDDKKNRADNQDDYTYYVQCDNGLTDPKYISEKKSLTFKVDTSLNKGMSFLSPQALTSVKKHKIILETEKQVEYCSYGVTEDNLAENLITTKQGDKANKRHESKEKDFKDGKYTYFFSCKLMNADEFIAGYHSFTIDSTAPIFKSIDDGITTSSSDTLSAVLNYEDNESGIKSYEYAIGAKQGASDIYNWKNTTDAKVTVTGLKLVNKTKYYWSATATNNVGLKSSKVSSSDGITVNTEYISNFTKPDPIDLCKNNKKDINETGADCGGSCPKCSNNNGCAKDSDCASKKCVNNVCKKSSCEDTILNQDESDIDCGGTLCETCEKGKACSFNSDCASNSCEKNICAQPSCFDGKRNGDESDIDCGGKACEACEGEDVEPEPKDEPPKEDTEEESSGIGAILLLIFLFLILLGGGGYYYYIKFMQKPSFDSKELPPLGLKSSSQPLNAPQQQYPRPTAGRFMPLSAELRKKKEELRKKQHEDILGKFEVSSSSAKKDTPKLQEKAEVKPEQKPRQQSQSTQQSTALLKQQSTAQPKQQTTIATDQELNKPLTKSSSPPQLSQSAEKLTAAKPDATKQSTTKQDPLTALAKTVKGKSGNAIEELRKKVKK
ncbi:hypothetical protein HZA96_02890 [Candidatus Woesearchaeota archaeon]|nr:hypothetical protein [Candidatus Woesearchaeota archaeon]